MLPVCWPPLCVFAIVFCLSIYGSTPPHLMFSLPLSVSYWTRNFSNYINHNNSNFQLCFITCWQIALSLPSLPPLSHCSLLKLSKKISGSPRDISCAAGSAVDATWHLKVPLQVSLIWQPFWRRLCCCRPFLHTYAFMLRVCVFVFMVFSPWDKHRFVVTSNGGCDGILSGGVCASERKRARRRRALAKAADGCKSTACHIKRDSFYEHTFFYSPSLSLSLLLLKPLFMCLLSADNLSARAGNNSSSIFCSISCIFQYCAMALCGLIEIYRSLSMLKVIANCKMSS